MASGTFAFNTGTSRDHWERAKSKAQQVTVSGAPESVMSQRKALSGQVGTGSPISVSYNSRRQRRRG